MGYRNCSFESAVHSVLLDDQPQIIPMLLSRLKSPDPLGGIAVEDNAGIRLGIVDVFRLFCNSRPMREALKQYSPVGVFLNRTSLCLFGKVSCCERLAFARAGSSR